jgi:hypothetical protein
VNPIPQDGSGDFAAGLQKRCEARDYIKNRPALANLHIRGPTPLPSSPYVQLPPRLPCRQPRRRAQAHGADDHLLEKEAALTVVDTHAGAGLYRLDGDYAGTSGDPGRAGHAGNHADVLKHTVLIATLDHLLEKEAALTVVDTHAGAGLYRC